MLLPPATAESVAGPSTGKTEFDRPILFILYSFILFVFALPFAGSAVFALPFAGSAVCALPFEGSAVFALPFAGSAV